MAVNYAELGFEPSLERGLFCPLCSVGVLAHAWAQRQQGSRSKGLTPLAYRWRYTEPSTPAPNAPPELPHKEDIMKKILSTLTRRTLLATGLVLTTLTVSMAAQNEPMLDSIHFLIPGGAGGGWDGTARGTGEALTKSGLVGTASYENMSGGGGGKAIGYLIENAESNHGTLMVNSTPIVIRSLTGMFPHNFRDLTLIAGTIGDYAAMVVNKNSPIDSMNDLIEAYKADPTGVAIGGGSVPGSMDHLVVAMVMEAADVDPTAFKYIPYDAGGKAMAGLLSGEIKALSTGLSEAIDLAKADEIKIIGITAPERIPAYEDAPTMKEQGLDVEFVNWRGFFGAPGMPEEQAEQYREVLAKMYDTEAWEDVRTRNGWVNIHHSGEDFRAFLENQEQQIGNLMKKLGFL